MGRGRLKEYGDPKDRYFVGQPERKIIVIEDVATTGSSLIREIDKVLELSNVEIIAAYVLTDRMERRDDRKSVREVVEERGIPYYPLSTAPELLKLACRLLRPDESVIRRIKNYYDTYGLLKVDLGVI